MGLTQTGTTISVPHMLQEQIDHVTYVVKRCIDEGRRVVEATEEAETRWQEVIGAVNEARRPFQEACTPGYFNADGRPEDKRSAIASGIYFPSTRFFEIWAQWRRAGDFAGLIVS
jgi:cyclohexanone monooxygenase